MTPERGLWAAVLDRAVNDFLFTAERLRRDSTHLPRSASAWLLSNSREVGSFLFVCEVLEIDPAQLRKQLVGVSVDTLRDRVVASH